MSSSSQRTLIVCLVIIIVACLCLSVMAVVGAAVYIYTQGELPGPTDDLGPAPTASSSQIDSQMNQIQEEVTALRGLTATSEVTRTLLTVDELEKIVREDFFSDYSPEEAQQDAIILSAFGLLNADFDLVGFYQELYSEQIAGFYDNEVKEMYVVKGEGFLGPQRMTYAHEYVHVLQDQAYDMENGLDYNDDACEEDSERCAAIQALIEGDASLLEMSWFEKYATNQDQNEIFDFYQNYSSPVYDRAPAFMQQDFLFPYTQGKDFVQHLYDQNGWDAVDAAYRDLPVSTEQILHPEKYPGDQPQAVTLPDLLPNLGSGWEEYDRGVMGEWYLSLILGYGLDPDGQLSSSEAEQAAAGWGGDAYTVYYNRASNSLVMVLDCLWETTTDADEFTRSFTKYATGRFDAPTNEQGSLIEWQDVSGYTSFKKDGVRTTWILAPDAQTAQEVLSLVLEP